MYVDSILELKEKYNYALSLKKIPSEIKMILSSCVMCGLIVFGEKLIDL